MPLQTAKFLRDQSAPLSSDEDVNRLEGWAQGVRKTVELFFRRTCGRFEDVRSGRG